MNTIPCLGGVARTPSTRSLGAQGACTLGSGSLCFVGVLEMRASSRSRVWNEARAKESRIKSSQVKRASARAPVCRAPSSTMASPRSSMTQYEVAQLRTVDLQIERFRDQVLAPSRNALLVGHHQQVAKTGVLMMYQSPNTTLMDEPEAVAAVRALARQRPRYPVTLAADMVCTAAQTSQ